MVDTYRAAVARAAALAGGVKALSDRLHVPVADLMRWTKGESRPSKGVFLRIVDFIVETSKATPRPPAPEKAKRGKKPD